MYFMLFPLFPRAKGLFYQRPSCDHAADSMIIIAPKKDERILFAGAYLTTMVVTIIIFE